MIIRVSIYVLLFCIFLYLFTRWFERSNIWMPRAKFLATPEVVGLEYQDVLFDSEDGKRLHGWYIPCQKPIACLLFCHGNGGNISYRTESLRQFNSLNLNVFIFDYRGYGKSKGWLTEQGTYQDAQAAYQWLKTKEPTLPLYIFGRSLGANIAVDLAAKVDAAGLIYESGFNSVQDLGKEIFPFLPVRLITKYKYNALDKIKLINMPLMVIHSPDDEIAPFHHSKKAFDTAIEPKQFLQIAGGHNDGFLLSEKEYLKELSTFINKNLTSFE
jgi:uncharacterized protein